MKKHQKNINVVILMILLFVSFAFGESEQRTDIIEYDKSIDDFKSIEEEFLDIAKLTIDQCEKYELLDEVIIKQNFDDGEVMQIKVNCDYAKSFAEDEMTFQEFMDSLDMIPLTRGKPIVAIECNNINTCKNTPDCACLDSQTCDPKNQKANSFGCVDINIPENSNLINNNIVCDEGYTWDITQSNCISVKSLECKQGTIYFNGECISSDADSDSSNLFLGFLVIGLIGFVIFLIGAGAIGLIIYLVIKSSKKNKK